MTEREAFEQWAVAEDFSVARDQWDRYASIATQHALAGWQASRQQALEEAAALFSQPHMEYFGDAVVDAIRSLTTTGDKP